MTAEMDINRVIATGESQTMEFKSSFDREAIETLVAFANAQGGTLLVGVADNGSVKGVTLSKETLNEWLGQIKSAASPSIIPDIDAITIGNKDRRMTWHDKRDLFDDRGHSIIIGVHLTKNIEKYGSGFISIRKELEAYPEIIFRVEEIGGGVLVTFDQSEGVNEGVSEGVNEGVNLLYQSIAQRPGKDFLSFRKCYISQ